MTFCAFRHITILTAASSVLFLAPARATTLNIPGTANIFAAGGNAPSAPAGSGAGTAPSSYAFTAGADQYVAFKSVTGTWGCCGAGGGMNGPDGLAAATNVNSTGMVSGIVDSSHSFFLVGVFLAGALPEAAPGSLNFSPAVLKGNFTSLSPELGQLFFIGDGLTGTGSGKTQQFYAPATATRLFLGVADAQGFQGNPGFYEDNVGQLQATFFLTTNPEPRTFGVMFAGLLVLFVFGQAMRPRLEE